MHTRLRRRAAASALAAAMVLGAATPALAQSGGPDTASVGLDEVETIGSAVGSLPLGSTLGSLGSLGSTTIPLDGAGSYQELKTPPRPVDQSITASEFLRVVDTVGDYEYWLVTSAAMKREVIVEVVSSRVPDQGPAPVLYLLDGVDAPEGRSGFHRARIADLLREDNVHVVVPTGAYSSYYADWNAEDPVLGNNKWETFLTEELPGIVEDRLSTTGSNGIGGVSMGGQAAMHLAATHPDLYRGVMSISGYYSTTDELGYQSIRGAIEGRGGELDNLWGPRGSDRWRDHDTISHVRGLKNTAVYFSTGNTAVGEADIEHYGDDYASMVLGLLLEKGVLEGSRAFERELDRAGIEHHADYADTGFHSWHTFASTLLPGWNYIRPALQN